MREDEIIKIAIAETSDIIRNGLAMVLKRIQGLKVVIIEIVSQESLTECIRLHQPDMLIVNPAFSGYFDISKFKNEYRHMNIRYVALICSVTDHSLLKEYDESITLYDDADILREKFLRLLNIADEEDTLTGQEVLSSREKEIIICVVKGMTNKEIADVLFLSAHTVITHRRNIARKLQIHSPAGLTIYAIVNKLVEIQEIADSTAFKGKMEK